MTDIPNFDGRLDADRDPQFEDERPERCPHGFEPNDCAEREEECLNLVFDGRWPTGREDDDA
mgnify:CR=1 FL=1